MKKILRIITNLETESSSNLDISIVYNKEKLTIRKRESRISLLLIYGVLIFFPLIFFYYDKSEIHLIIFLLLAACSITTVWSYYHGVIQGDNCIEIDLRNQQLMLVNINPLGKWILPNKTISIQRTDKVINSNTPLYHSNEIRLSLQQDGQLIPLIDLTNGEVLNQLSALLNIMIKRIEVKNQNFQKISQTTLSTSTFLLFAF